MLLQLRGKVRQFVKDENGSHAVEILMVLAVAAMVVLGVTQVTGVDVGGQNGGTGGMFQGILDILSGFGLIPSTS